MSATEELRRMLDERGVKMFHSGPNVTYFETPYGEAQATEYEPGVFGVMMKDLTLEQAIAATLGIDRHPYEQRITGDGTDWGEIMRSAYDDLMANASESCTPEQMRQLTDYIRGEMSYEDVLILLDELGVSERTCVQVLTDYDDGLIPLVTAHCSACGAEWGFTPKYCHDCGAKVTGTRDERKVVGE